MTCWVQKRLSFRRVATIGRSDERVIVLPDAAARVHARITATPGGYQLLDENSANGVFANGERIQSHWLKDGDEVRVGDTFFSFRVSRWNKLIPLPINSSTFLKWEETNG